MKPDPHDLEPSDDEIRDLEERLESTLEDHPVDPIAQAAAEMEARVHAAAQVDLPEPPSEEELRARVEAVTGKATIQEARADAMRVAAAPEDMGQVYRGTANGLQLAYAMLGLPIFGLVVGYFIDGKSGNTWKPILCLAGAVIGIGYVMWRSSKANS